MDDVLIDCPWEIDEDMIKSLNISIVVHGTIHDPAGGKDSHKVCVCVCKCVSSTALLKSFIE